ncbi:MAG TPA: ferredoxin--NADP reductase [Candidatus Kapabacteria bacterium]|nr:ferredoxin--NADP reductase [Candidatus Kapabacteria bacterium]
MAIKFYTLKIADIKQETIDTVSISFEIPQELIDIFTYRAGQYITIKVPINGEESRRAYSLSSTPNENYLTITVKKVDEGKVSNYVNNVLKIGDSVEVMPPLGNFTIECNPNETKYYLLIGGGSGITPLMSIIKTVLAQEPQSKITLLYQNRNQETIIFKKELEQLTAEFNDKFTVIHYLSKDNSNYTTNNSRLDSIKILHHIKDITGDNLYKAEFYICGPQGLMSESDLALKNLLIASYKVHKENFTAALDSNKEDREDIILDNDEELIDRKVKVYLYGEEFEAIVAPDETILSAGLREGFDPPFSCQIGVCSTCRARLKSGKVYMDERDSLTDDDIDEGYILTCQAHPLTDDVVVDYDDN